MYPIVRIFDMNRDKVTTNFWRMCLISNLTGLAIFCRKVEEKYRADGIPWENSGSGCRQCTGFYTHFKKNPDVFKGGCNCHILHNMANHASDDFTVTSASQLISEWTSTPTMK